MFKQTDGCFYAECELKTTTVVFENNLINPDRSTVLSLFTVSEKKIKIQCL